MKMKGFGEAEFEISPTMFTDNERPVVSEYKTQMIRSNQSDTDYHRDLHSLSIKLSIPEGL
jgi:hypothetical protein